MIRTASGALFDLLQIKSRQIKANQGKSRQIKRQGKALGSVRPAHISSAQLSSNVVHGVMAKASKTTRKKVPIRIVFFIFEQNALE
jgi:hypothetical protein